MSNVSLVGINLFAKDHQKLAQFYGAILGVEMTATEHPPSDLVTYSADVPGFTTVTFHPEAPQQAVNFARHQFKFRVSDLDLLIKNATAAGGSQVGRPMTYAGERYVMISDPENNVSTFIGK